MNKTIKFLTTLLLLAVSVGAWAEEVAFTFATSKSTSNNAYATNYDITVNGMAWSCPGNQDFSGFVRIGGKNISTDVDRDIYSKAAMSDAITKITFNHNGISNKNLKVNKITLTVASDASFNNVVDTKVITPTFSVGTEGSFDFTPTSNNWAANSFYKFTINVTNTKSSNYGLDVTSIVFYKENGGSPLTQSDLDLTGAPITLSLDLYPNAAPQTISYTTSSTGAVTVSGGEGYVTTSVDATNKSITVTPTAVTPSAQTITVNQAADDEYEAGSVTFTVSVVNSATYTVTFDAGNGTFVGNEDFPNTSNTKEAGEYTLPSVTPVSGYTFDGWVTTGNDTPLTGSYTVSGNVNFTAQYSQSSPASATIDLRGVTTALSFNAGAFTANGTGYQSYENVTYVGSNNLEYAGWTLDNVMHNSDNMQMRKADGRVTMPTILSDAGVKISVAAITNDVTVSDGTNSGTNTLEIASTSADVTISAGSKYAVISTITITPNEINAVATPTFSVAGGEYIDAQTVEITCATEGASIFYTIDGTDPTAASNPYTQAITISATTTLKAIAVMGEDVSNIATATYTFPLIYQTIAEFKAAYTTGYLNMSGAQVVYIDSAKKNIYVRDNSGAVDIYNRDGFTTEIKTGDFLGGVLYGKYSPYKNLPEITNADLSNVTITGNEVVVAKVIEGTTEAIQANLCDLVKIQNTQIIESNNDYYVGENEDIRLYDYFNVDLTFETEMDVDVQGIASIYDTTYELFPRYAEDIVYLENSVPVSISAAGMATFCSDKALDFTAVDAIHAYYVNVDNSGNLTFTRIRKIPANTGVLLRNAQGEDQGAVAAINVPVLSGEAEPVEGNAFVAVLEEIAHLASKADGFNNYILNKIDGRLGFYHANNQKVGAGKAYLRIDESIQARDFFGFNEGEATGIENVNHETTTNGRCYNLNGQQVSANYKGIVIVNGKKTIVK